MPDPSIEDRSDWWNGSTRWSLVELAGRTGPTDNRSAALAELLEIYREPLRRVLAIHARRLGLDELTPEGFFAYALEREALGAADRERGRFRQFIQGVARHYALEERRAVARGRAAPLEAGGPEPAAPAALPDAELERQEERAWALGVLEEAFERLAEDRAADADLLRRRYGGSHTVDTPELARRLGIGVDTLRRRLSRARERLRPALHDVLRDSVTTADEFDREVEWIVARLLDACPGVLDE